MRSNPENYLIESSEDIYGVDFNLLQISISSNDLLLGQNNFVEFRLVPIDNKNARTSETNLIQGLQKASFSNAYINKLERVISLTDKLEDLSFEEIQQSIDNIQSELSLASLSELEASSLTHLLVFTSSIVQDSFENRDQFIDISESGRTQHYPE